MRLATLLLAVLALPACATIASEPENLVDRPHYRAGGSPSWTVEIGDDIVLRLGHGHFDDIEIAFMEYRYPSVQPTLRHGLRQWRSRRANSTLVVETHAGPCTTAGGQVLRDIVRVVHHGRELTGCGEPWTGERDS